MKIIAFIITALFLSSCSFVMFQLRYDQTSTEEAQKAAQLLVPHDACKHQKVDPE